MSPKLIVISNRVAIPRSKRAAPGGLAVGVLAALNKVGGIWFGWNGKVDDHDNPTIEETRANNIRFVTQALSQESYDFYYKGYANRVLWPLFHLRLNLVEYRRHYFDTYLSVNANFAHQLTNLLQPDDLIWVHDYHCIPIANQIRKLNHNHKIGFFLHVPFPAYDVFRTIPDYQQLICYLLDYDLIGFQTILDRDSFLDSIQRCLPNIELQNNLINYQGRSIKVDVFPIGIDWQQIQELTTIGLESAQIKRLKQNLMNRRLITGIDRLDYSKGLPERFLAFEQFLAQNNKHSDQVVYMQVAQPSRTDVPEYQEIRDQVNYLAGKINGRFAEYDRVPLRYLNKSFTRTTILGFLSLSHIALVTPLRDGMNLVAKEFVASQNPEDPGVLILSRLTGAAYELDQGPILVTPCDVDSVADAIKYALNMSLNERKQRWQQMMQSIQKNDITHWCNCFLTALEN